MSEPKFLLKDRLFNRDKVATLAGELASVHPGFHADVFVADATSQLPDLELKARIAWIAESLERHLPGDYRQAVGIILRSLPAPNDPTRSDGDFGDFIYAPYGEYVARHGCTGEDLDFSLAALREVTTRFSAEDAIRTFINAFPDRTLLTLLDWTGDEHYHVRRLCSEGTRPRLPWSRRLSTPPTAAIPILDRLFADPTRFVTRSVANHINDLSKSDPDLAVDTLARWRHSSRQDPREMEFIVRHGTRTLIKEGHPGALELLGLTSQPLIDVLNVILPAQVAVGAALEFSFDVRAYEGCDVVVDYAIRFQGSGGTLTGRKVFKIKRLALAKGEQVTLHKRHTVRPDMTTRRIYPGRHELDIRINGTPYTSQGFRIV